MSPGFRGRRGPANVDGRAQHNDWLALVEVDGPFLTLPVLLRVWPTLDPVEPDLMARLRDAHAVAADKPHAWIEFVVEELLGLQGLVSWGPTQLSWREPQHDIEVAPSFAVFTSEAAEQANPSTDEVKLLGYVLPDDQSPTGRVAADEWAATWTDRAAQAGRALDVELSLVVNGRQFCLVWSPRGGVSTTATFDSQTWPESADRVVVRAFASLLGRRRFTGVPVEERLPALLRESLDAQEEITDALGVQVRRAVEQLVEAFGRHELRELQAGRDGLSEIDAHEVYAGAVAVMMRIVFLLFAEERGLLPADNPVYATAYAASTLCEDLEQAAGDAGEEALEHSYAAWLHLLATSRAVYRGIDSPRLRLPAYDGSLFDPNAHSWLDRTRIDDRTVLHVMRSVQYVEIRRERRRVSFRAIDVEQIGYVYEGLLAYDAFRADRVIVGLVGKAGHEAEVALEDLEAIVADHTDDLASGCNLDSLTADVVVRFKDSGIGSVARVRKLLELTDVERAAQRVRLYAATDGSGNLAERLLPFAKLLRDNLLGLPTVILAGALYVTASDERAKTGTHYTPRWLAEQVTEGALKPLVYGSPGPLDTDDEAAWVAVTSGQILSLKVADIAMGSGAFLVAACRYLADRLVEAWAREARADATDHIARRQVARADRIRVDGAVDPVVTEARRQVVQHCLYGVDINPMAVEMAKLSLWIVSMDRGRPFTFLDDRLLTGDSLLGIATLDQLESLHMLPARGKAVHRKFAKDPTSRVRSLVADLSELRSEIADMPGETLEQLDTKRQRLHDANRRMRQMNLVADLVAGSALFAARRGLKEMDKTSEGAGLLAEDVDGQRWTSEAVERARGQANRWLGVGHARRLPLHWPLAFPEAAKQGGFDGIVGNPPFLGGKKISGTVGTDYREYLVRALGRGHRGNADLVAYFVLRAHELLNPRGQAGLVATNTLGQGDTREVGLDQLTADGVSIRAAIKSEPWPSRSAVLQYCAVWTSKAKVQAASRRLDGVAVRGITASLDPASRVAGKPHRLAANSGIAFQGSIVLGMGFTMQPDDAQALIEADPSNDDVLFPYLNGHDVNSRHDSSASRWVINFHNWSEERARTYRDCFRQVEKLVKPERQRRRPDGSYALRRPLPQRYWHYADKRPTLMNAIADLDRVIVITLVSKVVMPVMVPTGQVFAHKLAVFACDDPAMLALLSSAPHYWWAIVHGSTLESRTNYSPSDVFETLARPRLTPYLRHLGERLDRNRRELMSARRAGLTATYNLVHDPDRLDEDVVSLRGLHREIDLAVFEAYGWHKLSPAHDHYETRQGVRWTVGPETRREMLDRLLELNQARYAEEQGDLDPGAVEDPSGEKLF